MSGYMLTVSQSDSKQCGNWAWIFCPLPVDRKLHYTIISLILLRITHYCSCVLFYFRVETVLSLSLPFFFFFSVRYLSEVDDKGDVFVLLLLQIR